MSLLLRTTIAALIGFVTASSAAAQAGRDEALAAVYPGAAIRAEQAFLTDTQRKQIAVAANLEVSSSLVARYIATRDGRIIGRAYIDTHTVRTKRESLLIALDEQGRVKRIEVTAFLEPPEYRAADAWLRQYQNRTLTEDVAINRAIRPIAGATLTARAINAAVRRVLATDAVLVSAGDSR